MRTFEPYNGKLGPYIVNRTLAQVKRYKALKQITKQQSRDYAEDTSRYNSAIRWYEIIRYTFEEWQKCYPNDAAVIGDLFGLGDRSTICSVIETSMKRHYSTSTVYELRKAFILDCAFRAVASKLFTV